MISNVIFLLGVIVCMYSGLHIGQLTFHGTASDKFIAEIYRSWPATRSGPSMHMVLYHNSIPSTHLNKY